MGINTIRGYLKNYCPNIKILRKILTNLRIKEFQKKYLPENIALEYIKVPFKKKQFIEKLKGNVNLVNSIKREMGEYNLNFSLLDDVLFYNACFGFSVQEYCFFDFKSKTDFAKLNYISDAMWREYIVKINDCFDGQIYGDKTRAYKLLSRFFYRDALIFNSNTSFEEFVNFVTKYPTYVEKIAVSGLGKGVSKKTVSSSNQVEEYKKLKKQNNDYLLEELVVQSKGLAAYNNSSVNTVRLITFITRKGVIVPFVFFRVGKDGAFVDNAGADGIFAGVDPETGIIITNGIDKKNFEYEEHPCSKVKFKGNTLPDWNDAINLVVNLAMMMPTLKIVGWDLAHTENGWLVIEANHDCQIGAPQRLSGGGLKKEIINILKDVDLFIDA